MTKIKQDFQNDSLLTFETPQILWQGHYNELIPTSLLQQLHYNKSIFEVDRRGQMDSLRLCCQMQSGGFIGVFVDDEGFIMHIWKLLNNSRVTSGPSGCPTTQRSPPYCLRLSPALTLRPIKAQPRVGAEVLCESFISFASVHFTSKAPRRDCSFKDSTYVLNTVFLHLQDVGWLWNNCHLRCHQKSWSSSLKRRHSGGALCYTPLKPVTPVAKTSKADVQPMSSIIKWCLPTESFF